MRIDDELDTNNRKRRVMTFDLLGIDNYIRLGEVWNNCSTAPVNEHIHRDSFEFVLFQTGMQRYSTLSSIYTVNSGEMFFSKPNELHSSAHYAEEKSHFFYFIFYLTPQTLQLPGFSKEETTYIKSQLFAAKQRIFPIPRSIFSLMKKMLDCYFSDAPFRHAILTSSTAELMCTIVNTLATANNILKTPDHPILEEMKEYIESNISKKINPIELAHHVNLSESRVHQIFRENGLTLHDYILRQKIEIAKEMLFRTNLSVTDIAFQLDFSTSQHFSTVFMRYTRKSPSAYRQEIRGHQKL